MSKPLPLGHIESKRCSCHPEVLQVCPECDERPYHDTDTCWRCDGRGLVPKFTDCLPVVVVHRDVDLRRAA